MTEETKEQKEELKQSPEPESIYKGYKLYLIMALVAVILFNQWQIYAINNKPSFLSITGAAIQSISDVIPTGIPAVYGAELSISYDNINPLDPSSADAIISVMGRYDRAIILTDNDLQRYINILYNLEGGISCEYCCGAQSVIFKNGEAACGCAHSESMRGLTKYLIKNHPTEFTDEEILEELGKWKTLFFPGIMSQKAAILKEKGIELNYINLASNKYRGIEKGTTSSGGMVGGC